MNVYITLFHNKFLAGLVLFLFWIGTKMCINLWFEVYETLFYNKFLAGLALLLFWVWTFIHVHIYVLLTHRNPENLFFATNRLPTYLCKEYWFLWHYIVCLSYMIPRYRVETELPWHSLLILLTIYIMFNEYYKSQSICLNEKRC